MGDTIEERWAAGQYFWTGKWPKGYGPRSETPEACCSGGRGTEGEKMSDRRPSQEHGLSLLVESVQGNLLSRWWTHMKICGRPWLALRLAWRFKGR